MPRYWFVTIRGQWANGESHHVSLVQSEHPLITAARFEQTSETHPTFRQHIVFYAPLSEAELDSSPGIRAIFRYSLEDNGGELGIPDEYL